mmetsp:Transcript_33378/g.67388  ORF Transcript_33378/g.67388 Transcript_33378/m.67388 type:complete len:316 (-) Transcript_33378:908-1855(-)
MTSIRIIALSITMALSLPATSSSLWSNLIMLHLPVARTAAVVAAMKLERQRAPQTEPRHRRQRPELNQTRTHRRGILSRSLAGEAETTSDNKDVRNDGSTNNSTPIVDSFNFDTGTDRNAKSLREEQKMITSKEQCSPMGECELCPRHWKSLLEKEQDEEGVTKAAENGEYGSCAKYGRRQRFECTVLVHEDGSSKKSARNHMEYQSCMYTESDEQFRMLRMQLFCLVIGCWSMKTVRKQKVASASLFDQRRMRRNHGTSGASNVNGNINCSRGGDDSKKGKYSSVPRDDSMETVAVGNGGGKVPKSPSPHLQTV